ncbi:MAG TPA: hypothetical protein VLB73_03505 [Patescibacteria group bacterium]|nr:hypothetical protein [Patescibacteria group bacterium]
MAKSKNWQDMMEEWFGKLPSLPKGGRDVLAQVAPWFALIFGVLGVLAGLGGLGILSVLSPMMLLGSGLGTTANTLLSVAIALVGSVLMLVAFPGLKKRKMQGWNLLFWSEAVSFVSSLVAFSFVGGVIGALIGFYLLYQIKSYYK